MHYLGQNCSAVGEKKVIIGMNQIFFNLILIIRLVKWRVINAIIIKYITNRQI
jgi:hypothetical protein